jgi:hypothetical protein
MLHKHAEQPLLQQLAQLQPLQTSQRNTDQCRDCRMNHCCLFQRDRRSNMSTLLLINGRLGACVLRGISERRSHIRYTYAPKLSLFELVLDLGVWCLGSNTAGSDSKPTAPAGGVIKALWATG